MSRIIFTNQDDPAAPLAGQVVVYTGSSDGMLRSEDSDGNVTAYGGSQPGVARVLGPFPVTHATAGITTGAALYTPAVGDVILDVIVAVQTAFDNNDTAGGGGLNIGTFLNAGDSWYDTDGGNSFMDVSHNDGGTDLAFGGGGPASISATLTALVDGTAAMVMGARAPVVVLNAVPLCAKLKSAATVGAAHIYFIVSTPSLT